MQDAIRHFRVNPHPRAFTVAWLTAFVSGWVGLAIGTGWDAWVLFLHGASGVASAVLAPWSSVSRTLSRARRWRSSLAVAAILVITCSGVLHAAGVWVGRGGYASLTLHIALAVVFAVAAALGAVVRLVRRRATPEPAMSLGRREVLLVGLGTAGALAVRGALDGLVTLVGLDGADRRYTGSFEVASFEPDRLPTTYWLGDVPPTVEAVEWELIVQSGSDQRRWTYAELLGVSADVQATIDCTGGWYSTQQWRGVGLDELLAGLSGSSIQVRSLSGYSRSFPRDDADRLLLALELGGRPLSAGHGFPARLVAPGRRGFWWVKWVSEIHVTNRPWWWQPPFPLQ